ncbi:MAG: IS110 family transposase [Bacteroidetes bacterium 41-46]|nr:MAG: IS110 family transposase [Bacteroidetes bacterium 41-46]
MISVGIDISKGKSTVCMVKPYGEVICLPFEMEHTDKGLSELSSMLLKFNEEVKVVIEATGIYHLPVLSFLQERELFVAVVNPFEMKQYRSRGLRSVKTDKRDSIAIANYGIDCWFRLKNYEVAESIYQELKILGRQYSHYMRMRIESVQSLTHLLDYTMPGIKNLLKGWQDSSGKDKLSDFVEVYWHFDNITRLTEEDFIAGYAAWAKEKGYHQSQNKAVKIYSLAHDGIPTLPAEMESTQIMIQQSVNVLKQVNTTLKTILTRMKELAKKLPEYPVVRAMGGVGDVLAPKLIAEIGDVRRFHSGKALIAYAGIDAPPYQSGQFTGTNRKISKRGSSTLRKIGYEVMRVLKTHSAPEDSSVYYYILKKESEGKSKKLAKIAGLNKFLRIYYARVKEVYQ